MSEKIFASIEETRQAISENLGKHWVIGFSGGKDSTATLKIFLSAYNKSDNVPDRVSIIYCDTGVENPVVDGYVRDLFARLSSEFEKENIRINLHFLKSPVEERFFVRVIGRGYPTPTNSFRWCTKGLRIKPVEKFLASTKDAIVVLGSRRDESQQRRRSIQKYGGGRWQTQGGKKNSYRVFLPILEHDISDVWDSIFMLGMPNSIDPKELETIYRDASGDCPIIKSPVAPPCASGRFGCWTCTVVRRDKSAIKLIDAGYSQLRPYLEFRDWLSVFRDQHDKRWPVRRNGSPLPGPFSLKGRSEILVRLNLLEKEVGKQLLDDDEREEIERLWALDVDFEKQLYGT
jgi:DNA sulfur modification protein DndC